jgi:ligand-binding sensor domain-containing protein
MHKKILISFLTQFIFLFAFSQLPTEFIVTPYNEINGISTKSISDIVQGSDGFMWITSYQGLVRFDGYSFKTFSNQPGYSNSIVKMAEDKNQNIWLALTDGTLAKFNPLNASFTNIKINFTGLKSSEKPGGFETIFFDKDNNLWLGITRTGLVKVDVNTGNASIYNIVSESDTYFSPEIKKFYNRVLNIYEDENRLFWLATPDGLYTFNRITGKMKQITKRPAKGSNEFRNDNYRRIIRMQNKLWIAGWGSGLSSYDLSTGKIEVFKYDLKHPNEYTFNIFHSIIPRNDSEIMVASADRGFLSFNTNTHKYYSFSNNPLYSNIPNWLWTQLLFDKDKNIWALNEVGLEKIQIPDYKFKFHVFPVKHSDNQIFYELIDIYDDDDIRLVATNFTDGLQVYNKNTNEHFSIPIEKMKGEENITSIVRIKKDREGIIWVLSRDYVYQYDEKKQQLIKPQQPPLYQKQTSNNYSDLTIDREGNIWIGSVRNGMFLYNKKNKKYSQFSIDQDSDHLLPTNLVSTVCSDSSGRIWFSSNRGFISYFDLKTKTIQSSRVINDILHGLSEQKIYDLFVDSKGYLWISTKSGLIKINCQKPVPSLVKTYTTADGLHSDFVVGLVEDTDGRIWGAETSIFAVSMIDEKKSKIVNYGMRDGLNHSGEIIRLVNSCNNRIWVLAQGGYYECDPMQADLPGKDERLAITIMAVNSIDKHFQEEILKNKKVLLEPNENSFYFEFAAIDFSRPETYQFAYKLDGFDTGWTYCGNRKAVSYTNIPGGDYIFKVKMTTIRGEWNDRYISIPFFIKTPFYKKWWFILLLVVVVATGLFLFYRYRMKQQKQILSLESKTHALGKEKSRVQYENLKQHLNPHFLFNSLTSLSSLIRVDQKLAIEFLDGMSKIYRYILQSKDEELVNISDEIKFIQTFIQLQKTRFEEGLQVNIHVADEYNYKKIVPVTLQNLVENAIKHNIVDRETPLCIEMYVADNYLIVRNNLQKKKFVETSNKQGLDNLISLYHYLSDRPLIIEETAQFFTVKIPLI